MAPVSIPFSPPLVSGTLIRRYKRFLADVRLDDGKTVTAHTANTGSMLGCSDPGSRVWLSQSPNPKRKYAYSWELVETDNSVLVGINTGLPNRLVKQAVLAGMIKELAGYDRLRSEVTYGMEKSRIDILLENDEPISKCYVEIKNVTAVKNQIALFPDAVSERGSKHLRELMAMVAAGHRAVIFYCIQRNDINEFRPADNIDPVYGKTLRRAITAGVEPLAYRAEISIDQVYLTKRVPVLCP